jgi:polyferredoxin
MENKAILKALSLDFNNHSPAATYRRHKVWLQRSRRLSQLAFAVFIIASSVMHHQATVDGAVPSIDALCPFGGIETLWRFVSSGGQYVPKTHLSNLVLLAGLVIGTLVSGGAFCGWVCPFGFIQDVLASLRRRLHLPELVVPDGLDRVLRYGRFVTLALILYQTISTVKLWFADYDPYRLLYGLDWLFEPNVLTSWPAYLITVGVLFVSFFLERGFCRYACPLGGAISVLGKLSLFRIRRSAGGCKGCAVCEVPCPVKLHVASANIVSSNCIGCMACVEACPRKGTLEMQLKPAWIDCIQRVFRKSSTSEMPAIQSGR